MRSKPNFHVRSEYRSPNRNANNSCGTEGTRSPGCLPRVYGQLNSEIAKVGTNIPSPEGYKRHPVTEGDNYCETQRMLEGPPTPISLRMGTYDPPALTAYTSKVVPWSRHTAAFSEDCYDEGFM